MIQTFQIVTLLQGIFLLLYLFRNRKKYHFYNYVFFSALILSLIFYVVGDDNNNLFLSKYDFFFLDKTLFVTILYLFLKHFNLTVPIKPQIAMYFIPCLMYIAIELYEANLAETHLVQIAEYSLSFIFIFYILASFYVLNKLQVNKAIQWPLYFFLASLLIFYIIDLIQFLFNEQSLLNFNSILILEVSLLLYYLTFIFVFNNNFLNLPLQHSKYKNSSLNPNDVETYKK